ncbi:MscS family mechanosensitive ion channel [hydrothermal vent metagenome]|uniref:MscS family mechanosensitive ion channel n=1 Tax=hydrothermal vent metagenome TaxID=652676 RepID=A0A1W1CG46_9ZZZZ
MLVIAESVDTSDSEKVAKSKEVVLGLKEKSRVEVLLKDKEYIEKQLTENNIWSKIYSNYHTYQELKEQKILLSQHLNQLEKKPWYSAEEELELKEQHVLMDTLLDKLQLLKEYEEDPFKKFLKPPLIDVVPNVQNPFAVISAFSYKEKLESDEDEYKARYISLQHIMEKFKSLESIIYQLISIDPKNISYASALKNTQDQIETFTPVIDIFKTTANVYSKKVDEIQDNLRMDVKREIERTIVIGAVILFFLLILLMSKYLVSRYMSDNDRFYSINKALNLSFISILIFTLLFSYIENVSYLVTILGFASAGIAIAMKDWFMSIMGWVTIIMGGAITVGDRIKFVRDGVECVGDIVDISMLRMTMHEDVTLTSYMVNRRSGRMIFIPNHFIFTDMISNYTHAGLKTVWDGIDFMITFDSDIQKAASIAKEVSRKYSKGYTDITRKQLNKLRSQYSIRNTNVEPRILTLIEPYGMKISAWYLTNSYATLTLRSTISAEIIRRIHLEDNIRLAFPTQSIYRDTPVPKPQMPEGEPHV